MTDNKLMTAAATLHYNIETKEWQDFFACVADNFNPKHFRERKLGSNTVWAWSMNRWGRDFALEEYRIRDLNDANT